MGAAKRAAVIPASGSSGEEQRREAAERRRRLAVPVGRFGGRSGAGVITPLDNCEKAIPAAKTLLEGRKDKGPEVEGQRPSYKVCM